MMTDDTYNGWTNYETWAANLWLTNDSDTYGQWIAEAYDAWERAEADDNFSRQERAALDLDDRLKERHEEANPLGDASSGLYSDLLNAALSEINWHEIAVHLVEAAIEETEATA